MRLRMALGLTVVLGLSAGLEYKLLRGLVGPDTLWTLIGIDAAALLLLLVYSIAALTAHLTALREMLNSLDIYIDGRHEHRLPVQGSGLLTDLSRRINDVLAHDAEREEMNSATPGIKRVVRPAEVSDPHRRAALLSSPQASDKAPVSVAPGEGVGPVRVRRRDSQGEIARFDTEVSAPDFVQDTAADDGEDAKAATSSSAVGNAFETLAGTDSIVQDAPKSGSDEVKDSAEPTDVVQAEAPSEQRSEKNSGLSAANKEADADAETDAETDAEHAPAADPDADALKNDVAAGADSNDKISSDQATADDGDDEDDDAESDPRRLLHEEYLQAKKRFGEPIEDELDFVQFNANLDALAERIINERGCLDVRFELRIQDGTVALQPRIIREKSRPPASPDASPNSAS